MTTGQRNHTKAFGHLAAQSNTGLLKQDPPLGIKCVPFPGINVHSFSFAKLYWQRGVPIELDPRFKCELQILKRIRTAVKDFGPPHLVKFAVLMKRVQI